MLGRPKHAEDLWEPEEALLAEANRTRTTPEFEGERETLEANAVFDHVLFDARAYGMQAEPSSRDEADYLGLPGPAGARPGGDAAGRPAATAARQDARARTGARRCRRR